MNMPTLELSHPYSISPVYSAIIFSVESGLITKSTSRVNRGKRACVSRECKKVYEWRLSTRIRFRSNQKPKQENLHKQCPL